MSLVLHSAWRASAPYRLRIALNLKGLAFDYAPVDLAAGEQRGEAYGQVNAQHLVPALVAETAPDQARATVRFTNLGTPRSVELQLVKLKAGWRIREVTTEGRKLSVVVKPHR